MGAQLSVLLLCDDRPGNANTILDHINAFARYSQHRVKVFNPRGLTRSFALDLGEFDVAVIHYSLILSDSRYVSPHFRRMLQSYRGLKVQFIQDEYRWVDRATDASREIGIDILFTAAPEPAAGRLYDERLPGVRRVHTLTGYVPEGLRQASPPPLRSRRVDVGYRGRDLPFWLGRLTQEKRSIAEGFQERSAAYGLRTDIAWRENDRVYGQGWIDFMASCRATLGTESGASIADFDGAVERQVRTYLRDHADASFDEVEEAVLRPYEGNVIVNVISPRVFEAAALGTALVMFPGHYSGIASPDEHYIVLEKDFSNMDAVVAKLKDEAYLEALTRRAHDHLIASERWSYAEFIRQFDQVIAAEAKGKPRRTRLPRHQLAILERNLRLPPPHVRLTRAALTAITHISGREVQRRSEIESWAWLAKARLALRAILVDRDLRAVFVDARRAGVAMDEALEEVLELYLLQKGASGMLRSRQRFRVHAELDPQRRNLRFVSDPEGSESRSADASSTVLDALQAGTIEAIEWDHRGVGQTVDLDHPHVEIGVGSDGRARFERLARLSRDEPDLIARLLGPALGVETKARRNRQVALTHDRDRF